MSNHPPFMTFFSDGLVFILSRNKNYLHIPNHTNEAITRTDGLYQNILMKQSQQEEAHTFEVYYHHFKVSILTNSDQFILTLRKLKFGHNLIDTSVTYT